MYQSFWYWEYTITYYDDLDKQVYERSGVVTGENMQEVIQALYDFYGESKIKNIWTLKIIKIISDSNVLEFNEVNQDKDIDFIVDKV